VCVENKRDGSAVSAPGSHKTIGLDSNGLLREIGTGCRARDWPFSNRVPDAIADYSILQMFVKFCTAYADDAEFQSVALPRESGPEESNRDRFV